MEVSKKTFINIFNPDQYPVGTCLKQCNDNLGNLNYLIPDRPIKLPLSDLIRLKKGLNNTSQLPVSNDRRQNEELYSPLDFGVPPEVTYLLKLTHFGAPIPCRVTTRVRAFHSPALYKTKETEARL
ncbi:MAG: hypothetical protein RBG13Loki_4200 [Promethearchaeota archaeon CR_4]|nr:MAG: hypothetical protein RBG13Loki_4200 [Candidatus Lokiarchaeota archaeon CR_4]